MAHPSSGHLDTDRSAESQIGWRETVAGLGTYFVLVVLIGVYLLHVPDEHAAWRGVFGMAANGIAGSIGLMVAFILRIRDFRAFGFRATESRWLFAGMALGVAAFGASFIIEAIYFSFINEPNTQADFQAAAKAGPFWLTALFMTGALLTPFGEECVFRGIVASAWNRYGPWASIVGSAVIFAVAHGPSVILLDAFMVGILTGVVFSKAKSIWPAFVLHAAYNGLHLVNYAYQ